ncbi:MAG: hypothetical protein R3B54_01420 [Bdellovibrionota bacterium]
MIDASIANRVQAGPSPNKALGVIALYKLSTESPRARWTEAEMFEFARKAQNAADKPPFRLRDLLNVAPPKISLSASSSSTGNTPTSTTGMKGAISVALPLIETMKSIQNLLSSDTFSDAQLRKVEELVGEKRENWDDRKMDDLLVKAISVLRRDPSTSHLLEKYLKDELKGAPIDSKSFADFAKHHPDSAVAIFGPIFGDHVFDTQKSMSKLTKMLEDQSTRKKLEEMHTAGQRPYDLARQFTQNFLNFSNGDPKLAATALVLDAAIQLRKLEAHVDFVKGQSLEELRLTNPKAKSWKDVVSPEEVLGNVVEILTNLGGALFRLFAGGKSMDQMILEQLEQLRELVTKMFNDLSRGQKEINVKLQQMHASIEQQFSILRDLVRAESSNLKGRSRDEIAALNRIAEEAFRNEHSELMRDRATRWEKTKTLCTGLEDCLSKNSPSEEQIDLFMSRLLELTDLGVDFSHDSKAVGRSLDISGKTSIPALGNKEMNYRLGGELPFHEGVTNTRVVYEALKLLGIDSTGESTIRADDSSDYGPKYPWPANTGDMTHASEKVTQFLSQGKPLLKERPTLLIRNLKKLLVAVRRTRFASDNVFPVDSHNKASAENVSKVLANYELALNGLMDEIGNHVLAAPTQVRDRYLRQYLESEADDGKEFSIDKLRVHDDALHPNDVFSERGNGPIIPLCGGTRHEDRKAGGAESPDLPVSKNTFAAVRKLIPDSFQIAQELGLGRIELCYRTEILNERYELQGYTNHLHKKIFGIPAIVLEARFRGTSDSRLGSLLIFKRAVHDGSEKHIRSEVYLPQWSLGERKKTRGLSGVRLGDEHSGHNQEVYDAVIRDGKNHSGVSSAKLDIEWSFDGLFLSPESTKKDERDNRSNDAWLLSRMPYAITENWSRKDNPWVRKVEEGESDAVFDPMLHDTSSKPVEGAILRWLVAESADVNSEEIKNDAEKGAGAFSGTLTEIAGAKLLIVDAFAKAMGDEFEKDEELQRLLSAIPGPNEIVESAMANPEQYNARFRRRKSMERLMKPVQALLKHIQAHELKRSHQGLSHVILKLEDLLKGYGENTEDLQVSMKPSDGLDTESRSLRNRQILEAVEQYDLTPSEIVRIGEIATQLQSEGKTTFNLWTHYGRIRNSSTKPSKEAALVQIRREYNFELAEQGRLKKLLTQVESRGPYTKSDVLR